MYVLILVIGSLGSDGDGWMNFANVYNTTDGRATNEIRKTLSYKDCKDAEYELLQLFKAAKVTDDFKTQCVLQSKRKRAK